MLEQGLILATLAQYDIGIATFLFLQLPLCGRTVHLLGSEEQKEKYLPELVGLEKIWGWSLT